MAAELEELNPETFTYDNYEMDFGHRLGLYHDYYAEVFQFDDFIHAVKEHAIGYCDASRLAVRPIDNGFAVMCEDEDGKFWFHILEKSAIALGIIGKP